MVNALHKVKDPKLDKYERLKDFIISRMIEFFSECKRNALIHVENIIECEDAYINVEHDDLVHLKDICTMKDISDNDKEKIYYALDMLKIKKTLFNGALKLADHLLEDEHEEFILKNDAPQINILEDDNSVNKAKVFEEQKEVDDTLGIEKDQPIEITPHQREEQILLAHRTNKDFFNTFRPEDNMNIRAEKILLNRIGNNLKSFPKKQYDFDQIMVVKRLIISYFSILKKKKNQIKDLIQKCMVCKFFNKIDKMNLFITEKLFSSEIEIKDLLLETEAVTIERRRLDKRIGVLRVCLRALNRSSNTELEEDTIILPIF